MFFHPSEVCMDYVSHFKISIRCAFLLFIGSLKAFVHSVYPDIFITSTSETIQSIQKILKDSGCNRGVALHLE
tara:strand:+ start:357 stop:575 length:219 start_codon:yes stop_codon:yes gene_type:complete